MKNKLTDLNDHLFAELERLGNEDLKGDELQQEIARAKAISGVSKDVISGMTLALDAQKALADNLIPAAPPMLGLEKKS